MKYPAEQAAGLSHFLEELEEVIAIGVYNTSRRHRGRGQRGRGRSVSFPEPNPADVSTAHSGSPAQHSPNHANLEVLNTTLHASSKPESTWTDWKPEGTRGCLSWPSPAPGRLSSPPLGGIVLQDRDRDGLKSLSCNLLFLAVLNYMTRRSKSKANFLLQLCPCQGQVRGGRGGVRITIPRSLTTLSSPLHSVTHGEKPGIS